MAGWSNNAFQIRSQAQHAMTGRREKKRGKTGAGSSLWGQHRFRNNQVSGADRNTTKRESEKGGGMGRVLQVDDEAAVSP